MRAEAEKKRLRKEEKLAAVPLKEQQRVKAQAAKNIQTEADKKLGQSDVVLLGIKSFVLVIIALPTVLMFSSGQYVGAVIGAGLFWVLSIIMSTKT